MGPVSPETAEQIVNGGTVGLIAFMLLAITALIAVLGIIVRAFVKRTIITRETYLERDATWRERLVECQEERDEAVLGWREQTRITERMAEAVEKLTAALEARNSLDLEFHRSAARTRR
jgi:hypothetical protein